jgi:hypothetical protein
MVDLPSASLVSSEMAKPFHTDLLCSCLRSQYYLHTHVWQCAAEHMRVNSNCPQRKLQNFRCSVISWLRGKPVYLWGSREYPPIDSTYVAHAARSIDFSNLNRPLQIRSPSSALRLTSLSPVVENSYYILNVSDLDAVFGCLCLLNFPNLCTLQTLKSVSPDISSLLYNYLYFVLVSDFFSPSFSLRFLYMIIRG